MNSETFKNYIENPNLLNQACVNELESLLNEFPYFQTAWTLYAKNLFLIKDVRFKNKIKLAALHSPDRLMLYRLINESFEPAIKIEESQKEEIIEISATKEAQSKPTEIETPETNIDFSDDLLEFAFETIIIATPANEEYLNKAKKEIPSKQVETELRTKNRELLDRFISDKPKVISKETEYAINTELPEYHKDEDEFITETLAQIYIKQGHFDKALLTYEKLSLKYPEKSIYFAGQIKMINELKEKNA
ncbi:MAG: hypothetical protein GX879_02960 [Bacteroidales bacterium]|nr:hypothetical protein [Bacteroidales bacterium]